MKIYKQQKRYVLLKGLEGLIVTIFSVPAFWYSLSSHALAAQSIAMMCAFFVTDSCRLKKEYETPLYLKENTFWILSQKQEGEFEYASIKAVKHVGVFSYKMWDDMVLVTTDNQKILVNSWYENNDAVWAEIVEKIKEANPNVTISEYMQKRLKKYFEGTSV